MRASGTLGLRTILLAGRVGCVDFFLGHAVLWRPKMGVGMRVLAAIGVTAARDAERTISVGCRTGQRGPLVLPGDFESAPQNRIHGVATLAEAA